MVTASQPRMHFGEIGMRCLAVGFAYSLASALASALLGPMSRLQPTIDNVAVWLVTGTLVCLTLAPFILHSTWSRTATILAVWGVLAFVRALGLGIEGSLFKPAEASTAIAGAISGALLGLLVAWLSVVMLFPLAIPASGIEAQHRGWWGWTWRVLVVGLAYFVFYFVFGATNALLYTKSFYENNPQYGLSIPPAGVIFIAQLLRGPLFGLASMFIVRSAQAPRNRMAVWLGLLLFVVGGLGPYLEVTFRTMPLGFNLATLLEIFLQNFLTGIVAVNLFQPRQPRPQPALAS